MTLSVNTLDALLQMKSYSSVSSSSSFFEPIGDICQIVLDSGIVRTAEATKKFKSPGALAQLIGKFGSAELAV